MQVTQFLKLLTFKGARFDSPTDLRARTVKWNTASLFMRYIIPIDCDRGIFRYSCDTFCAMKSY